MNDSSSSQRGQATIGDRMERATNIAAFVSSIFAAFAEVTLFRTQLGERFFNGWRTVLVIPLLLVFPLFWPYEDPRPLWFCLVLYLVKCIVHRVNVCRRRARGETGVHSLYNGISRLEKRWPRAGEATLKGKIEPGVMFGMGLAALIISPPLGWFFIWCAVGMAVHAWLLIAHQRQRMLDLADARIEGQLIAGPLRGTPSLNVPDPNECVRIQRSDNVE